MSGRGDSRAGGDRTPSPVRDRSQRAGTNDGYNRGKQTTNSDDSSGSDTEHICTASSHTVESQNRYYSQQLAEWKKNDTESVNDLKKEPKGSDRYNATRQWRKLLAEGQETRDKMAAKHDPKFWGKYWEDFNKL